MRILLLTQWFDPEPGVIKGLSLAKRWADHGHEVQVLTGFPNYPAGQIYDGYKLSFFQRECIDGVSVMRVPLYPSHDKSPVRRILNYSTFALSASTIGLANLKPVDVMYVYHPPPTVGLPAIFQKLLRHTPYVYDIQDFWPETLEATGMFTNKVGLNLIDQWCRYLYRKSEKIVVLSPGFKRLLIKRNVPAEKICVVYNWCEEDILKPQERNSNLATNLKLDGHFNIIFAGNLGKAQALRSVIEAARLIYSTYPSIQFVFVGAGLEENSLKNAVKELAAPNVLFIDRMPLAQVVDVLNLADVLLVHLKDDPLYEITIPSKIQAYMSVGRPILAAVRGDGANLVQAAGAGLACIPEDAADIAEKVVTFYKMAEKNREIMGDNGRRYYREHMSLAVGADRLEEIMINVSKT